MVKPDTWKTNPEVVLREESDEWALLFDLTTGQVVGVNPVGAFIWKHLVENTPLDEISSKLKTEFVDAPDTIENELTAFLNKLIERGFIGIVNS